MQGFQMYGLLMCDIWVKRWEASKVGECNVFKCKGCYCVLNRLTNGKPLRLENARSSNVWFASV